jgi:IMP dehydrogenase
MTSEFSSTADRSAAEWDGLFYPPADVFFPQNLPTGLTFDDLTLATQESSILPRETNLTTYLSDRIRLSIPMVSADMDTVTESRMAIAMALNGGLGLIHYNMTEERQLQEVARVKNHIHGLIQDPVKVSADASIGELLEMIARDGYQFSTFPVVDSENTLLGLVPGRMVKERYHAMKVSEVMSPLDQVFTIQENELGKDPIAAADKFFHQNLGIHKLLVVNGKGQLKGLFTLSDVEQIAKEASSNQRPARDSQFRLLCGVAVSAPRTATGGLDRDRILAHAHRLVGAGADALAVSTAHGFSSGVADMVRLLRAEFNDITLIAGNVTSAEGVEFLARAGVDAVKIGQGPGSICTTRQVAGVGIPQMTALYVASKVSRRLGVRIIADGGITKSGDMVKALTLADAVICGSLLAGCREAPGRLLEINGKLYKQYRGMGSREAMRDGSAARYGHDKKDVSQKAAAEGVEALKEVSGKVDDTLRELVGGVQSGMGYLGAGDLSALRDRARYIRITQAGRVEAAPHDVITVKADESGLGNSGRSGS